MKWNSRTRCLWVCFGLMGLFSLFSYRLIYLQIIQHDYFTAIAAAKHEVKQPIFAKRGTIVAAQGELLASDVPGEMVVADATRVNDAEALTPLVADTLQLPFDEVAEKLSGEKRYVVLQRSVPPDIAKTLREKIKAANLRGIYFEPDPTRAYPNGSMLCHVIGFTDFDHKGIQGVEKSMEDYLRGEDGYRYIERTPSGKEIMPYRGQERGARNGFEVALTIDLNLQNIVENEIDAAVREFRPQKAIIILMRPDTGEILAMANRPNFDLNRRNEAKPEEMKNRAITDMMEPGSTFKIVTTSAALNERKVRIDSSVFCENGVFNYGGRPLHDHHGYGELSVQDILVKSSNIGAAKLALMLGEEKFYEYIRSFGFGERTGVELPGEIAGRVYPPRQWNKISITRMPMGHEVGVSSLQMITAMCAIANGGKLVTPRIVKSITTENGQIISESKPTILRQVISPQTAAQVGNALRGVVSDRGTAAGVSVPGFTLCGKTGTAQKVDPENGGYESGKYLVSFSGYMPADRPAFVGLVVLDDAKTATPEMNYGGKVAAPIFAHIAEKAARYLDLEPSEEKVVEKPGRYPHLEPHEEISKPVPTTRRVALTNAVRR
ncbi:MAG: penicillin-binding protein 2 [Verrucomicrobiota bacterium]|nr:penicillin-binding protein 2 [Verrucomicrobiota bacterium]